MGPKGPSGGEKGEKGQQGVGEKGQQGNTGNQGQKGDVGPKGADGSNGSNGAKGQQGEVGPKGADGSNGSKGAKGQQGEVGPKGEPGVGGGGGGGGSGIQKLPTNFLDMVSPSYHSSGNIYESGASVRPVTIPAHGSIYWAVDAQWISGSPGVYLWIWLSNTQYNATSNDNILENALFVPGSVPSTPPGFWRAQKFANPGIPNTLTEAAGWPEGGQNGYPAYDPSSLL